MLKRSVTIASAEPSASPLESYSKISWQNGYNEANPDNNTPVNADNLNHMDIGIYNVTQETINIRDNLLAETKNDAIQKTLTQVASNIEDSTYSSRYYIEEEQPESELAENIKHIATEIAAAKLMVDTLRGDDEEKLLTVAGVNQAVSDLSEQVDTNTNTLSTHTTRISAMNEDLTETNNKLTVVEDYLIASSSITAKDNMAADLAPGHYIYSFSADKQATTRDENGNITPTEYSYTAYTAPLLKTLEGEISEGHIVSKLSLSEGSISVDGYYIQDASYIRYLADRISALEVALSITPLSYDEWKDAQS